MTRIVETAVGRHPPALHGEKKVELLGVAGAGKSTLGRTLSAAPGFAMAEFIHTRKPSHFAHLVRSLPGILPILARGLLQRPRISWPEIKLLAYVTRWHLFLGNRPSASGGVLMFDQGPLYALVRLQAEQKPFSRLPAFLAWRDRMLARWARELHAVIWLDAPDDVLLARINDRPQAHRSKGEDTESGRRFISRYRHTFEEVFRSLEELRGPSVLRFDTSEASAEQIAKELRSRLATSTRPEGVRRTNRTGVSDG